MLIFNCSKAAAERFVLKRRGEKISCLQPAPHKTIAESIDCPVFPDEVAAHYNDNFQWQWVVHCVSIKRKRYMLVMDYHTRYCLLFPAGKKGDEIAFLNAFEEQLKASFRYWIDQSNLTQEEASDYIAGYDRQTQNCAFYQRGDRSAQTHLNEVVWYLKGVCEQQGEVSDRMDCLKFGVTASNILRKRKEDKDYFRAHEKFFEFWLNHFGDEMAINSAVPKPGKQSSDTLNNVIDFLSAKANKK